MPLYNMICNLYGVNPTLLEDGPFLRHLFAEVLPATIGMNVVAGPLMPHITAPTSPLDDGYSLIEVIDTSSIYFHAFPGYDFLTMEVSSCKEYPASDVISLMKESFAPQDIEVHTLTHALRWQRHPAPASPAADR